MRRDCGADECRGEPVAASVERRRAALRRAAGATDDARLAVEVDAVESGVYNITGPRVAIDTPTMELIATHFGDQTEIRGQIDGYDSPLSCEKARLAFGYKPKHSWAEGVDTAATVQVAPAGARL